MPDQRDGSVATRPTAVGSVSTRRVNANEAQRQKALEVTRQEVANVARKDS